MSAIDFVSGCFSCGNEQHIRWKHNKCDNYERLWDDGDVYCKKCGNIGKIWELKYKCSNHPNEFRSCDPVNGWVQFNAAMSVILHLHEGNQKFVKKLMKEIPDE